MRQGFTFRMAAARGDIFSVGASNPTLYSYSTMPLSRGGNPPSLYIRCSASRKTRVIEPPPPVYGKALTTHLLSVTSIVCGICHTGKADLSHSILSSVCKKVRARCQSPPHKRLSVGSRLAPSCDSPNTSRRFVLDAINVCLVGDTLTCTIFPVFLGYQGICSYDGGPV